MNIRKPCYLPGMDEPQLMRHHLIVIVHERDGRTLHTHAIVPTPKLARYDDEMLALVAALRARTITWPEARQRQTAAAQQLVGDLAEIGTVRSSFEAGVFAGDY